VVAVAVIVSGPSGLPAGSPVPSGAPATGQNPEATPMTVQAAAVPYLAFERDSGFSVYYANIDRVCPGVVATDCGPVAADHARTLELKERPRSLLLSPGRNLVVVMDGDTSAGGGQLFAFAVPTPAPVRSAEPSATPMSADPTATEPAPLDSSGPSDSNDPDGPTGSEDPSLATDDAGPSNSPESSGGEPSTQPEITTPPEPSASVSSEPEPTPVEAVAIASGVVIRDESAAYSADGRWFAFSAWPADGSHGPDVYLWRTDELTARPVTSDHRSVFASWLGNQLLGSRAIEPVAAVTGGPASPAALDDASPEPGPLAGEAFVLDPETLVEAPFEAASGWRPVAAPAGGAFVYWDGSLRTDASGLAWQPAAGRLVLIQVAGAGAEAEEPGDGETAGPPFVGELTQVLRVGPIGDYDIRWDTTGTRVGIWIADPDRPGLGHLSLYLIQTASDGTLRPVQPILVDEPALPGFSLADGRLAWVAPPSDDGEGSRIDVLAWSVDGVGSIETSARTGDLLVIR
jgi:hypothetical protein